MKLITLTSALILLPLFIQADSGGKSIGSHANGRLQNASILPDEGIGFMKIIRKRNRAYGNIKLINFLIESGMEYADLYPEGERLQIGDMSAEHGGKITRHKSHQIGLDADISYLSTDYYEQDPDYNGFKRYYSNPTRSRFDVERNWELFKRLIDTNEVLRIFVSRPIKRYLCKYTKEIGERDVNYHKYIRAINGHHNHFHLRLKCPEDNERCRNTNALPGNYLGC